MKLFNEQELLEDISLKQRTNFRYALLDANMNYIQELSFLDDVVLNKKINTVSELTFTTPMVFNQKSIIDIIRPHYIIEAWSDYERYYFLVLSTDIKVNDKENTISFQVYEYPRQLAKDIIFEYEETSKTLPQVVKELLSESSWKLGYVDSIFEFMYRSFSLKQITLLEALQNIAKTYNALILWKSKEKTIEFINPSRLGTKKGLVLSEDKYLEGIDIQINSEEIITRLYAYGHDNISLEEVTPTGSKYIEDYSWFMKPFKMDSNGKVLESSYYMTDGLCKNLINYQSVLKENEGRFAKLLDEKREIEKKSKEHWLILTELQTDYKKITDKLDVLNSTQADEEVIEKVVQEKLKLEKRLTDAIAYDHDLLQRILAKQKQIEELHKLLRKDNYFTREQLLELDNFTITKIFQDTAIEDVDDLLEDAIYAFNTMKLPQITMNVNLLNFLENKEYQFDWNKLELGDIITVELKNMAIEIYAQIMEIEYSMKDSNIKIVLANENSNIQDIADDYLQLLYDSKGSSTIINMDKYKWDLAEDANDGVSQILNNAWDSAKQQIQGGVSQSVTISERGLIIRSSEDTQKLLIAQNGVLGLSRDGGNTWKTAITPDGIFAERLVGRILMGNRLIIEDEQGIIKIEGSKQTVYDPADNEKVVIGKYDGEKYGIKINQGALEIVGGLTEDNVSKELFETLTDDTELREDLRLESPLPNHLTLDKTGITAKTTSGSDKYAKLDYRGLYVHGGALDIRTIGGSTQRGIVINGDGIKGYSTTGKNTFSFNSDGTMSIELVTELEKSVTKKFTNIEVKLGEIVSSVGSTKEYVDSELAKTIKETNSKIEQTEKSIISTVNETIKTTNDDNLKQTDSKIEQTEKSIISTVNETIRQQGELISSNTSAISQHSDSITAIVETQNELGTSVSKLEQTSDGIILTVTSTQESLEKVALDSANMGGVIKDHSSSIKQLKDEIELKVTEGEVESIIKVQAKKITIKSEQIEFDGKAFGSDAVFTGTIRAKRYLGLDGSEHTIDFGDYGWINGERISGGINSIRLAAGRGNYVQITDANTTNFYLNGSRRVIMASNGLTVNGNVYADNIGATSARDQKKNIEKYTGLALGKVLNTNVYQYHFKDQTDTSKKKLGLIFDEAPFEIMNEDKESIDLYAMISLLWRAIQEQQIIIEELKGVEINEVAKIK